MEFPHDAYELLGVSRTANIYEIKESYRIRMLSSHPDKLIASGNESSNDNSVNLLMSARNVLCDPSKRREHDMYLDKCQISNAAYNKISLSEFIQVKGDGHATETFSYPCRCGDSYKVYLLITYVT